jgi:UDP-N-acetylmuramoyl-tripeptide--D-alanyl-D-alanine ligase
MPTLSIDQILQATGGVLLRGDKETRITSFEIDTRRLEEGGLFFALKGENTDGHKFLSEALQQKAAAAVVTGEVGDVENAPVALIRVDDSRKALTACAAEARKSLVKPKFVAVTGSAGKTTTKDLIATGLAARHQVHKTAGNFNNDLGVPLSLLACPEEVDFAVIELAMSAPGEIAALTRLVQPHFGLVTNIHPAHLSAFNTLDDIAAAKGELFALLSTASTSVANLDDMHVRVQSMRHRGDRVTYGRAAAADVHLEHLENRFVPGAGLGIRIGDQRLDFNLQLSCGHSALNALAALAMVHAVGSAVGPAGEAIAKFEAGPGRGCRIDLDGGAVLVDDSYNSNPAAVNSILDTLRETDTEGRKILVLGDMLELGPQEEIFHKEAGRKAASAGVDLLITVGRLSRVTLEAARRGGVAETHQAPDAMEAARYLTDRIGQGDLIVVKGSRGIRLDRLVQELSNKKQEVN